MTAAMSFLLMGCNRRSYNIELTKSLDAGDGLVCQGYLAADGEKARRVVLWMSGSGFLSNAAIPESLVPLIEEGDVAVVTFNKPGIEAAFGEPESSHTDLQTLEKYTQGSLIRCAEEALEWSEEVYGKDVEFLLRGHSEGSLIATYLYEAMLKEAPGRADRTPHLVLTGFPAEHVPDIVERQVNELPEPDRTTVRSAIEECDWDIMQKAIAMSCEYLEDAAQRLSGFEVFQQLAATGSPAEFYFFQGRTDQNTPASAIEDLEAWNSREGALNMSFSYYDGGHSGTDAAREELALLLRTLTGTH